MRQKYVNQNRRSLFIGIYPIKAVVHCLLCCTICFCSLRSFQSRQIKTLLWYMVWVRLRTKPDSLARILSILYSTVGGIAITHSMKSLHDWHNRTLISSFSALSLGSAGGRGGVAAVELRSDSGAGFQSRWHWRFLWADLDDALVQTRVLYPWWVGGVWGEAPMGIQLRGDRLERRRPGTAGQHPHFFDWTPALSCVGVAWRKAHIHSAK